MPLAYAQAPLSRCWEPSAPSVAWRVWAKPCGMRSIARRDRGEQRRLMVSGLLNPTPTQVMPPSLVNRSDRPA